MAKTKKQYMLELEELLKYKNMKKVRKARDDFFEYCHVMAPDFYRHDREYLKYMANEMQSFLYSDDDVLVENIPPRFGKSRTAQNFSNWVLGHSPDMKVMTGSYNEILSTNFSKSVRNTIQEQKADDTRIVFSDIFPKAQIKPGDGAANMWGLVGAHNSYLATSPTGTATGFGADIMIIDDLIKNAEEAYNDRVLEKHWEWFLNTMISRLEKGGKIIIIMTRWNTDDLAGKVLKELPDIGYKVRHINMKAKQDDGSMLDPSILDEDEYNRKMQAMGTHIAEANYNQNPIDIVGRLYQQFKTYSELPKNYRQIISYTDTADTGSDYLCTVIGAVYNGEIYIIDILYTKEGMEITEDKVARMLVANNTDTAIIESNNGGRGFARNVEQNIWEKFRTRSVRIKWMHQSKNKEARILSTAPYIMEHVYFPENWADRWPDYHKSMVSYQKEGKNQHDDAQDATTGLCEMVRDRSKKTISAVSGW